MLAIHYRKKRKLAAVHLQCQMRCYLARRELGRRVAFAAERTRVRFSVAKYAVTPLQRHGVTLRDSLCVMRDAWCAIRWRDGFTGRRTAIPHGSNERAD